MKTNLRVYFDGLCPLCAREIDHYRRCAGSERIDFVDITHASFSAAAENLDAIAVHRHLHARRPDGSLAIGVDAFLEIWKTLPKYHWLAKVARTQPILICLRLGYRVFARIRPLLPRRAECSASPYCESGRR